MPGIAETKDLGEFLRGFVDNNAKRAALAASVGELAGRVRSLHHVLGPRGMRDLAAVMLYYGSPLTAGAICRLEADRVRVGPDHRAVIAAESGAVPIPDEVSTVLAGYIEARERTKGLFMDAGDGHNLDEEGLFDLVRSFPNHELTRRLGFFYPVSSKSEFPVLPTPLRMDADPRYTGKGVAIAFIDTGFYPHPDLVRPEKRIVAYKDIGNPKAHRSDFEKTMGNAWHGMQTSVSACGNGFLSGGIYRGIAWNANLALLKARGVKDTTSSSIARCIEWCIKKKDIYNIRIINISLGMDEEIAYRESIINAAAEDAIQAGIVVLAAAGNDPNEPITPPASAPSVITVGGLNDMNSLSMEDYRMYWSSYGKTIDGFMKPEVIAPGILVAAPILPGSDLYEMAQLLWKSRELTDDELSALLKANVGLLHITPDMATLPPKKARKAVEQIVKSQKLIHPFYQHVDGTSFSSPIVASVVAQMIEANPRLRPMEIKEILMRTAVRATGLPVERQGHGIVSPRRAVECAVAMLPRGKAFSAQSPLTGREEVLMFDLPSLKNNDILFTYKTSKVSSVLLTGDFNGWNAVSAPMTMDTDGNWTITRRFPESGTYRYKFIADGRWTHDPINFDREHDGFGGFNSLIRIHTSERTPALLDEIDAGLKRTPVGTAPATHAGLLGSLDGILQLPQISKAPCVREFYLTRAFRAISRLKGISPSMGSAVAVLYSCGVLVKTRDFCLGLDIVTGRHVWGVNWAVPDSLVDRLVSMMDVLFITHRDPDHFDYDLACAMVKAGKIVVAPTIIVDFLPRGALGCGAGEKREIYSAEGRKLGITVETFEGRKNVRGCETGDLLMYRLIDRDGTSLVFTGDCDYTDSSLLSAARGWTTPTREGEEAATIAPDSLVPAAAGSSTEPTVVATAVETAGSDSSAGSDVAQQPAPGYGVDLLFVRGGPVRRDEGAVESLRRIIEAARPRTVFPVHIEEVGRSVGFGRESYSGAVELLERLGVRGHVMTWGEVLESSW